AAPIAAFWRRPSATEEAAASLATATQRRSASALAAISRRTVPIGRKQGRDWGGERRQRVLTASMKSYAPLSGRRLRHRNNALPRSHSFGSKASPPNLG